MSKPPLVYHKEVSFDVIYLLIRPSHRCRKKLSAPRRVPGHSHRSHSASHSTLPHPTRLNFLPSPFSSS